MCNECFTNTVRKEEPLRQREDKLRDDTESQSCEKAREREKKRIITRPNNVYFKNKGLFRDLDLLTFHYRVILYTWGCFYCFLHFFRPWRFQPHQLPRNLFSFLSLRLSAEQLLAPRCLLPLPSALSGPHQMTPHLTNQPTIFVCL